MLICHLAAGNINRILLNLQMHFILEIIPKYWRSRYAFMCLLLTQLAERKKQENLKLLAMFNYLSFGERLQKHYVRYKVRIGFRSSLEASI